MTRDNFNHKRSGQKIHVMKEESFTKSMDFNELHVRLGKRKVMYLKLTITFKRLEKLCL